MLQNRNRNSNSNHSQRQHNVCSGLVTISNSKKAGQTQVKVPIPLVSVDVIARVVHGVAQVKVTQVYVNKEKQPIEAVYYYPVNPDGAVIHFNAEVDGRVIKGSVKPSDEAEDIYVEAVGNQKTAFLGEETKADIFKVRVGFLKPGAKAKVIIGYVTEVKNEPESNAIRFYIPTTIAPLYVSDKEITDKKVKDVKGMTFSKTSPAPLTMHVAILLQGGITSIESPTHGVKVGEIGKVAGNPTWEQTLVKLSTDTTDMDRDFVLIIKPKEAHQPRLYSEKLGNGSTAMMVHFVPSFRFGQQKSELIFVLDRSGSMEGQNINLAKKALELFLHSMPADCYFNVIGFGSTYEFLFPVSVKNSKSSLETAINHAKSKALIFYHGVFNCSETSEYLIAPNGRANLNGTEILEPLQEIYKEPDIEGYLRQIFVLTDGEVSNTDGLIGVVQANAHKARVFALGIGDDASHYLVEGLAKVGRGIASFVTSDEGIESKTLKQLKNALQPSLTDIELVWDGVATVEGIKQSPKRIPPAYDGSQLLVFGLFQQEIPTGVTIKAKSPDGDFPVVHIDYTPGPNDLGCRGMLHRVAAIKLVRELEFEAAALQYQEGGGRRTRRNSMIANQDEEVLKRIIVELACENGITSRYTSFVAVDVNDVTVSSSENWMMRTRNVPSQLVKGSQGITPRPTAKRPKTSKNKINFASRPRPTSRSVPVDRVSCKTTARPKQKKKGKKSKQVTKQPPRNITDSDDECAFTGAGIVPRSAKSDKMAKKTSGGKRSSLSQQPKVSPRLNDCDGGADSSGIRVIGEMATARRNDYGAAGTYFAAGPSVGHVRARYKDGPIFWVSHGPWSGKIKKPKQVGRSKSRRVKRKKRSKVAQKSKTPPETVSHTLHDSADADSNSEDFSTEKMEVEVEELIGTPREKLIRLQSFDGVYEVSKKLANIVGKTLGALREGATKFKLSEDVFATAVAISYFEIQLAGESNVWELVVDKARAWLATKLQKDRIDSILQQAAEFLRQ